MIVKTAVDDLLEEVSKGRGNIDEISKSLGVEARRLESWASMLEKYVKVEYPSNPLSKPYFVAVKPVERVEEEKKPKGKVLESYRIEVDGMNVGVSLLRLERENVPLYFVDLPKLGRGTEAVLRGLGEQLSRRVSVRMEDFSDQRGAMRLREVFSREAKNLVRQEFGDGKLEKREEAILSALLLHRSYGLGSLEILMHDDWLEEISLNTSTMPASAYHIKYGWVKTNIYVNSEKEIYNLSSQIARKAGKTITNLNPIMDAHLVSGDRANATLFPVSSLGSTITIRKFSRVPWNMVAFLREDSKTLSVDMAALLWLCVHYELNVLITGGSASGKTSMLNALASFMPPNQRIVSIEDTRELNLPEHLHWNWIPLTTRSANPEGEGEVSVMDLANASLRMRPDRLIMGEVRRVEEAEVLFEAMNTGHAVYSTMHADTARHLLHRITEPPFGLPIEDVEALHLVVTQFRDRRKGFRKTTEIAELRESEEGIGLNYLYRWNPRKDTFDELRESKRVADVIGLHTGMSRDEIREDLREKRMILEWMVKRGISDINTMGRIIGDYYNDSEALLKRINKGGR